MFKFKSKQFLKLNGNSLISCVNAPLFNKMFRTPGDVCNLIAGRIAYSIGDSSKIYLYNLYK